MRDRALTNLLPRQAALPLYCPKVASTQSLEQLYRERSSQRWQARLRRLLQPPAPFIMNPAEPTDFALGRSNLYIGGAGRAVPGYVNLDLFPMPDVDVAADAEALPFPDGIFQRVECDAVLEHVRHPEQVMQEIRRVLAPGGYAHLVTPFCHPFHEYPKDYRRFTLDGLKELAAGLDPRRRRVAHRALPRRCSFSPSSMPRSCCPGSFGGCSLMASSAGCSSRCGIST